MLAARARPVLTGARPLPATAPQLLSAFGAHCADGPETAAARVAIRCIARLWVLAPYSEAQLPLRRLHAASSLSLLREVALDTELCPAAAADTRCRAFRHAIASHVARQAQRQALAAATAALREGPPPLHATAFHALQAWVANTAALLPAPLCDQAVAAAAAAANEGPLLPVAHQFHSAMEAAGEWATGGNERASLRIGALAPLLSPAIRGVTAGLAAADTGWDADPADAAADCVADALAWHSPEQGFLAADGSEADLADVTAVRAVAREIGACAGAIAAAAGQSRPGPGQRRALAAACKIVGALLEGHSHATVCSKEVLAAARGEAGAALHAKEDAQALVTVACALLRGPWDAGGQSASVLAAGCSEAIARAVSAATDDAWGETVAAASATNPPATAVACELTDAVAARALSPPSGDALHYDGGDPRGRMGAAEVRYAAVTRPLMHRLLTPDPTPQLETLASAQLWRRLTEGFDPDGAVLLCTECVVDAVAEAASAPGLYQRLLNRLGCTIAATVPAVDAAATPDTVCARVLALALASAVARELDCATDAEGALCEEAPGGGSGFDSGSEGGESGSPSDLDEEDAAALRLACEWWLALASAIAPPATALDQSPLLAAAAALAQADAVTLGAAGERQGTPSPSTQHLLAACATVLRHAPASSMCEAVSARLLGSLARVRGDGGMLAPLLESAAAEAPLLAASPHMLEAAYAAPMAALQARAALVTGSAPPSWFFAAGTSAAVTHSVAAALASRRAHVAALSPDLRAAWAALAAEWVRGLPRAGPPAHAPRVAHDALRLVAVVGDPCDVGACEDACLALAQHWGGTAGPWLAARVLRTSPGDTALTAGQRLLRSAGAAALRVSQEASTTWEDEEGEGDEEDEVGGGAWRALSACASLARELLHRGEQEQWELTGQWAAEAVRAASQGGMTSPSLWRALGALCRDVMRRQLCPPLFSTLVAVPLVWGQRAGAGAFTVASDSLAEVLHASHSKRDGVLRVLRRHVVDGVPWQILGATAPGRDRLKCMAAIVCHPRAVQDARALKRTLVLLATTTRTEALRELHASLESASPSRAAPTPRSRGSPGQRDRIEPVFESISIAALGWDSSP